MGEQSLYDVVHGAIEVGVSHLSVFGFSTENWKRPPMEVHFLMYAARRALRRHVEEMRTLGMRFRWAGRCQHLPRRLAAEYARVEELTRDNNTLTFTVCMNYGGRAEIVDAAAAIARDAVAGRLDPDRLDEAAFARYLDEPDLPDVDLFIRTAGEQRTSNFLPWQSTYAEMVFLDTLWPDFDRRDLWRAIEIYANRRRTFGAVS